MCEYTGTWKSMIIGGKKIDFQKLIGQLNLNLRSGNTMAILSKPRPGLIWFDLWCLMPLKAIFQLYNGDQF